MRYAIDQLDQEEFFIDLDDQEQTTLHTLLIKLFNVTVYLTSTHNSEAIKSTSVQMRLRLSLW